MDSGYFYDEAKEYVITDMFPRRKWLNYLWNDTAVCACDQFGFGTAWSVINGKRRGIEGGERNLTLHGGERLVYIKDTETGEVYAANRNYGKLPFDTFECRVGLGYQKVIGEYKGVHTEFTVLVPLNGNAVQFNIKITNTGAGERRLQAYFYAQPKTENGGHEAYAQADFDKTLNGIYYDTTGYRLETEYIKSYLASDKKINSYAVTANAFKGLYNDYTHPAGVESEKLCDCGSTFEEAYAGTFQFVLNLQAGETFETTVACGFGKTYEDCAAGAKMYADSAEFARQLRLLKEKNAESLNVFMLNCPDKYVDSVVNIWLKRQLSLGKDWGRLYGRGFRDVMQDTSAFVSLDPALARKRIPEILKHQYEDGNPIRMFEPDYTAPYNDSAAWIPATVLAYLYETGDVSVLDEKIPYLKGDSFENAYAPDGFVPYRGTEEEYTVFDHVKRAMEYLYSSRGKRGLILFRHGDWNDSMNGVGLQGKGESVWLTLATIKAYNEYIEILEFCGKDDMTAEYEARREELKAAVQKYGVDGDHLLYGYNDYDEKIGADENEYAKIYLNPQTWAVLAGAFDRSTLEKYMDAVERRLSCNFGYVQCAPSYREGTEHIGRVSYFKEGLIENGSVYNHGVAFKIVADCLLGRGDKAYETLKKISYDNPKNAGNGVEPYAFSNMYIGPENKYLSGYAPMSWITGTAGWLYRAITEYMCGVRAEKDGLKIAPSFPKTWKAARITRRFRGATYEIEVKRGESACGKNQIFVNGDPMEGDILPIARRGEICKVAVLIK